MFIDQTERELSKFFNVESASSDFSGEKPRLIDTATWWFRFNDLQPWISSETPTDDVLHTFINDLELSEVELVALFHQGPEEDSDQTYLAESEEPYVLEANETNMAEIGSDGNVEA